MKLKSFFLFVFATAIGVTTVTPKEMAASGVSVASFTYKIVKAQPAADTTVIITASDEDLIEKEFSSTISHAQALKTIIPLVKNFVEAVNVALLEISSGLGNKIKKTIALQCKNENNSVVVELVMRRLEQTGHLTADITVFGIQKMLSPAIKNMIISVIASDSFWQKHRGKISAGAVAASLFLGLSAVYVSRRQNSELLPAVSQGGEEPLTLENIPKKLGLGKVFAYYIDSRIKGNLSEIQLQSKEYNLDIHIVENGNDCFSYRLMGKAGSSKTITVYISSSLKDLEQKMMGHDGMPRPLTFGMYCYTDKFDASKSAFVILKKDETENFILIPALRQCKRHTFETISYDACWRELAGFSFPLTQPMALVYYINMQVTNDFANFDLGQPPTC